MSIFSILGIFVTVVALASYLNYRFFRLPMTIGLMFIGLAMSFALIGLHVIGINMDVYAASFLRQVSFSEVLMRGMLSFLLFAGALKIDLQSLLKEKTVVGSLATVGVVISTFAVGSIFYIVLRALGLHLSYGYCLVFGALISPTDPIAVLAILKSVKAPATISTKIAGESLFNDGVGVVAFVVLLNVASSGKAVTAAGLAGLIAREAVGGILFGLAIGWVVYRLLKSVDNYSVEILLTLALVAGGYALASALHLSGPLSMVVAGLLIGNQGRLYAMSELTRKNLDTFWELIDEFLNAVLFVWIGLEILVLSFTWSHLAAGLAAVPVVLAARFVSVGPMINLLRFRHEFPPRAALIFTWGGLRGAISVALALSLPAGAPRNLIVPVTYVIVVFSILVQGLTIERVLRGSKRKKGGKEGPGGSKD
jgi:CPA1 family monovalent cation:H+ antiporter